MSRQRYYTTVKVVSWVVLAAMFAAIAYSVTISIRYWSGIGV